VYLDDLVKAIVHAFLSLHNNRQLLYVPMDPYIPVQSLGMRTSGTLLGEFFCICMQPLGHWRGLPTKEYLQRHASSRSTSFGWKRHSKREEREERHSRVREEKGQRNRGKRGKGTERSCRVGSLHTLKTGWLSL
jgi:hypothetical protein